MAITKTDLIREVAEAVKNKGIRKPVRLPRQVFHISDNDGNSKDFVVHQSNKTLMFTGDDVGAIINTCLEVIEQALTQGESIEIRGFGKLKLHYRAERITRNVQNGEPVVVPARHVPKFDFGNRLRRCARLYDVEHGLADPSEVDDYIVDDEE